MNKLTTDVTEKVDVSKIELETVDGTHANARVTSMEAANTVLERWAADEQDAGPAECEVRIVFEDGFHIRSRYPLARTDKRVSLARHLRKQLSSLANEARPKRPVKCEQGLDIRSGEINSDEAARCALERYNI
jgi:hypothetical protein